MIHLPVFFPQALKPKSYHGNKFYISRLEEPVKNKSIKTLTHC